MNKISKLFEDMSNDELNLAITEIREDGASGIIRDGVVRKYARLSGEIAETPMSNLLIFTEINILRQAAFRWHDSPKEVVVNRVNPNINLRFKRNAEIKIKQIDLFYDKISKWLTPLGYVEVYRNNLGSKEREFHFIKNKVRVICVWSENEQYCYLHNDVILEPHNLAIKSCKFIIGTPELESLYQSISNNGKKLKKWHKIII